MAPAIVVVGAGVIGLTTAHHLQTTLPNSEITIIATEFPGGSNPSADYASAWAGAHYRPIAGTTPQLISEAKLARHTAEIMKRIAHESPEAGVGVLQGVEYLEDPPAEILTLKSGDVYAGVGDGFRVLDKTELPEGVDWGCKYTTYCVNVPIYCSWLLKGFMDRGGRVVRRTLDSAEGAFSVAAEEGLGDVSTVVNCSGRNFDRDLKTKIIRGQTVLVRQQYHSTVTRQSRAGSWAFLIPRPGGGGTIVGGTKEVGDVEVKARPESTDKLLKEAALAFPDFVDEVEKFEILRINVGRRPWREGGLRMDVEELGVDRRIVHGYGAGGRGYELSHGVAERLVELVGSGVKE